MFNARGLRWKRLRTIANPTFSVAKIKEVSIPLADMDGGSAVLTVHTSNGVQLFTQERSRYRQRFVSEQLTLVQCRIFDGKFATCFAKGIVS